MNGWVRTMVVAAMGLMSAGWNGSGAGRLTWDGPGGGPAPAAVDAVGTVGGEVQAVVTADLQNGNTGVLSVVLRPGAVNRGRLQLPSSHVRLGYAEYDPRGLTVFLSAAQPVTGRLLASQAGRDVEVELTAEFADRDDPHLWRKIRGLGFALVPVVDDAPDDPPMVRERGSSGGGVVVVHDTDSGGCSGSDWDDDDSWDDGDDWDSDSSSGGGCDGDDFDSGSSSSSSSGGGCEGDDVDGGGSGCEGDAIAASNGRRTRSPWIARAVTWLPWLLVFGFIRVARRDPLRRRGRAA